MNLVLIGFMGVGKTSIGKELAGRLKWSFIDTDSLIEESYSMSVATIFAKHGEASFRETERKVVEGIAKRQRCVIATGGGVVLDRQNVDCLKRRGLLIHLTLSLEAIFHRIGHQNERPLLKTQDPWKTLETLFRFREQLYRTHSDFTIDRDGLGVNETVERILTLVSSHGLISGH
ncbi:MAG: AAA family ATPase [Proteobacteria bacterium]|nr:AAA family ATPase [Pseudomonadota bacterium]NIS72351.1 AAA family ATPase [Pseudomonadota bacterium]